MGQCILFPPISASSALSRKDGSWEVGRILEGTDHLTFFFFIINFNFVLNKGRVQDNHCLTLHKNHHLLPSNFFQPFLFRVFALRGHICKGFPLSSWMENTVGSFLPSLWFLYITATFLAMKISSFELIFWTFPNAEHPCPGCWSTLRTGCQNGCLENLVLKVSEMSFFSGGALRKKRCHEWGIRKEKPLSAFSTCKEFYFDRVEKMLFSTSSTRTIWRHVTPSMKFISSFS